MSPARRPAVPVETVRHDDLQRTVTQLLASLGWHWLHVRKSIGRGQGARKWQTTTNRKGWPDLAPLWSDRHPGRVVAIEIKTRGYPDLSDDQVEVRDELLAAGWEFYVVNEDTDISELARTLNSRPHR